MRWQLRQPVVISNIATADFNVVLLAIILLVCVFGTWFGVSSNMEVARDIEQQQRSGTINGAGTSEATGDVCSNLHNDDFLTIQFDASFPLSQD